MAFPFTAMRMLIVCGRRIAQSQDVFNSSLARKLELSLRS